MQYQVLHKGKLLNSFSCFWDAWLYAYLDTGVECRIIGWDGYWTVCPFGLN